MIVTKKLNAHVVFRFRNESGVPAAFVSKVLGLVEKQVFEMELETMLTAQLSLRSIAPKVFDAAYGRLYGRRPDLIVFEKISSDPVSFDCIVALGMGLGLLRLVLAESVPDSWKEIQLEPKQQDVLTFNFENQLEKLAIRLHLSFLHAIQGDNDRIHVHIRNHDNALIVIEILPIELGEGERRRKPRE